MDENREKRKRLRAVLSFVTMAVLLVVLFFAAINIGSLKVSFGTLMRGLFVERIDEVATIYDLRFPRIIISMLAGAAIAVSGVLLQAVLKNPLADRYFQWSQFCGSADYGICAGTVLLYSTGCVFWRCHRLSYGVLPVLEGRLESASYYPYRCCGRCTVYRTFQCF